MRIQHNIMAMNSYRNYTNNVSAMKKNLEKLSSGYKINRAGDDAAGLAISEKMRAQITGLKQAQSNAKSGINLVQTAEGALTEVHDMLNRMLKLADQSANGTYDNTTDRYQLQKEVDQLKSEIDRIADSSNFNGINLLDGSLGQREVTLDATSGAVANGVQSIQIMGGGKEASHTPSNAGGPATNIFNAATFLVKVTGGTANSNCGKVTLTLGKAVTGIKWVAVGQPDGDAEFKGTNVLSATVVGNNGGSVTFKAVRDTDAKGNLVGGANAADVEYYEGMTITIGVDAAKVTKGTGGAADTYAYSGTAVKLATNGVGKATGLKLQIGDTSDSFNQLVVSIGDMHASSLGIGGVNIGDQDSAARAVQKLKDAINIVSNTRGTLGATQNRLDHTINNLSVMEENIQDAESNIRDTDVADEMMAYTKNNILIQSAQAMLAQANQVPQGVLQLLQ